MGKGSAPKSPDPVKTAAAQTGTNVTTAIANGYLGNINQVTPDGNLSYSYGDMKTVTDPTTGKSYQIPTTTVTQTLSQQQQAIKNQNDAASLNLATLANNQSGRLDNLLGTPFNLNGAPAAADPSKLTAPNYQQFGSGPQLQTGIANAGDITKSYNVDFDTSKYEDALMQRINPQLSQSRDALDLRLRNQGLEPGSVAYDRAIDAASRQENDARYGAILNAGQEQSRLAGLAQNQAAFQNSAQAQQYSQNANNAAFSNTANQQMFANQNQATAGNNALADQSFNAQQAMMNAQNQARSTYLNEQYALRNQPINEISALLSGGQVSNPSFVPTQGQSMPTVDYAGLVNQKYQNDVAAYNQSQAGAGALLGGLAGLFSLSDKTAKTDIKRVGELDGHGLYRYRYKGKHDDGKQHIGVMAQDVQKTRPDAVARRPDGKLAVNYGALFQAGA